MVNIINKKENIFGDDIAFVEQYDFSKANMSEENRINAITQVASICYQNPKAINSEALYNRLVAESKGLPSSSFEFVPIFINFEDLDEIEQTSSIDDIEKMSIFKYGEIIDANKGLLTNYRALFYDVENKRLNKNWLKHFNTEEECEIIAKHFKVFNYKVDLPTRSQMVRHRVSWQELSRRYVSGKKVPFEFYLSDKMKNSGMENVVKSYLEESLWIYQDLLEKGIKPQEARRIIPQAAYTQIWGAFQPTQLENFFKLRDDEVHAQWEISQVAKAMRELIQGETV